jgi:hypothetical protein
MKLQANLIDRSAADEQCFVCHEPLWYQPSGEWGEALGVGCPLICSTDVDTSCCKILG